MSLDPTLKTHGGLMHNRSVLSRSERIARLIEEGKFDPETDSPMGLPKLKVHQSKAGTKTKKAEEPAEGAAVEGEQPAGEQQGETGAEGEKQSK